VAVLLYISDIHVINAVFNVLTL